MRREYIYRPKAVADCGVLSVRVGGHVPRNMTGVRRCDMTGATALAWTMLTDAPGSRCAIDPLDALQFTRELAKRLVEAPYGERAWTLTLDELEALMASIRTRAREIEAAREREAREARRLAQTG